MDSISIVLIILISISFALYVYHTKLDTNFKLRKMQEWWLRYINNEVGNIKQKNEQIIKNETLDNIRKKLDIEIPENLKAIRKLRNDQEKYEEELKNIIYEHRKNTREIIDELKKQYNKEIESLQKTVKSTFSDTKSDHKYLKDKFERSLSLFDNKVEKTELSSLCDVLDNSFYQTNDNFVKVNKALGELEKLKEKKKDDKPKRPPGTRIGEEDYEEEEPWDDDEHIEEDKITVTDDKTEPIKEEIKPEPEPEPEPIKKISSIIFEKTDDEEEFFKPTPGGECSVTKLKVTTLGSFDEDVESEPQEDVEPKQEDVEPEPQEEDNKEPEDTNEPEEEKPEDEPVDDDDYGSGDDDEIFEGEDQPERGVYPEDADKSND